MNAMDDKHRKQAVGLAYRIAAALQKKLKNSNVGLRTQSLEIVDRLLFEFTLDEGGAVQVSTAYSQAYFEDESKEHVTWLAKQIYIQLTQLLEWKLKGRTCAYTSHASESDKGGRPSQSAVSDTGVVQNRRDTRVKRQRKTTVPKATGDTEPVYAEDVPAGLF